MQKGEQTKGGVAAAIRRVELESDQISLDSLFFVLLFARQGLSVLQ